MLQQSDALQQHGGRGVASRAARGGAARQEQEQEQEQQEQQEQKEEGERNIVRLLGNTSLPVSRLLELNESGAQWGCLNRSDLLQWPVVSRLPALLLELLPRGSLFHALAAIAAPEALAELAGLPPPPRLSLDAQRRVFKQRLQAPPPNPHP